MPSMRQDYFDKYRIIFDSSPDIIMQLDKTGIIIDVNSRITEISGYKKDFFIGNSFGFLGNVLTKESMELINKNYARRLKGEHVPPYEITARKQDGSVLHLEMNAVLSRDNDANVSGEYVFLHDITEQKTLERTIREKEDLYRSITETSPDGIGIHTSGQIVYANKRLAEMMGAKCPDELIGREVIGLVHPDSLQTVRDRIKKVASDNKPLDMIEEKFVRLDGTELYVETGARPIYFSGKPSVMVVVHDITRRKASEAALQETRAKINTILSSMEDIVFMFDAQGAFQFCHSPANTVLYIPPNEFIGKKYFEILPPHVREPLSRAIEQNRNGKTAEFDYPLEIRGNHFWFSAKTAPILSGGAYQGSVAVVRDVTERKKLDDQIRIEKEKLRKYLDICDVIFIALDANGVVEMINEAGAAMVNRKEDEIVGRSWIDEFVPENEKRQVKATFGSLISGNVSSCQEYTNRVVTRDGSYRTILWHNVALRDARGIITGTLSSGTDITERLRLIDQAEAALKAKEHFTATVSHELRTPLASIKEGISAVLDGVAGEIQKEQRALLQISKKNVDRLARLIGNVLDLQKMDAGQMDFKFEDVNINELINDVYETVIPLAKAKNLDLTKQILDQEVKVRADRDKIYQVLTNLLNNALQATEKGMISMSIELKGDFVAISISDSGSGIREEDLPKLFVRFSQIKRRFGGTGLGLAICKEIIEAHKGTIWAESKESKGSRFIFTIPRS